MDFFQFKFIAMAALFSISPRVLSALTRSSLIIKPFPSDIDDKFCPPTQENS